MGEVIPVTMKKEGGSSSSIKCPMLTSSNYTVWAMRMKITLKVHKVWEVIETESVNGDKNDLATALLFQSIPEALILQVGDLDTAYKVWDAIKLRHMGAERVREARLQTLMAEFDQLQMKDSEKIDDFAGKLSEISSKSTALGVNIEEPKLVRKFLKCLPRKKYIQIVASLEQVLDLNNTGFEDIIGRLKAYEERVSEETEVEEEKGKLMYANSESQKYQSNQSDNGGSTARIFVSCSKKHKVENDETQNADELMMHELVFLNEKNVVPEKFETNA
ncbi:uncharacterized protein LOC125585899 [Brassica napus]|uniref:uncharacterized protein LOC125585899 n=1 Tax=Brassica napus TaxID=3708 RepID=UPI00207A99EE|nr:uncharacterized protein LOC125585899 [Brassica napus]